MVREMEIDWSSLTAMERRKHHVWEREKAISPDWESYISPVWPRLLSLLVICEYNEDAWWHQHASLLKISDLADRFPQAVAISHEIWMGTLWLLVGAQQIVHNLVPLPHCGTVGLASLQLPSHLLFPDNFWNQEMLGCDKRDLNLSSRSPFTWKSCHLSLQSPFSSFQQCKAGSTSTG